MNKSIANSKLRDGQCACFSEAEIRLLYKLNHIATPGYLLFIKGLTQPEAKDLCVDDVTKFCKEWEISTAAFYRATKALKRRGDLTIVAKFAKQTSNIETRIRNRLHQELGGQVEVTTAIGRIDLLTTSEIIEVKNIDNWKEALRQILAYGAFFPEHKKRIHLFGKQDLAKIALIQATCSEFGIEISFEEVGDDRSHIPHFIL
ncbi:hypothetical protein ACE1AT_12610 [Pelatocladus sp. BLCC-F211]|uniref:hypothetical protein n=1 Tax=Pelatocladus sp. BLCC-F211 TaxID=3342752 RepID=UPI0035B7EC12